MTAGGMKVEGTGDLGFYKILLFKLWSVSSIYIDIYGVPFSYAYRV